MYIVYRREAVGLSRLKTNEWRADLVRSPTRFLDSLYPTTLNSSSMSLYSNDERG
jgi:hypothetical protein